MAEQNVFDLLNDDDAVLEANSPPKDSTPRDEILAKTAESSIILTENIPESSEATDQETWTDVSSTKTRKLAPQFTLSKENFGHDRGRQSQPAAEAPKKKVIRFTRDDLLHLRRATKPLPNVLAENPDITSEEALEPECMRPIDAEEVLSIWTAGEAKRDGGRGRGRGKGRGGDDGHYSHGHHQHEDPLPDDIWDDVEPAGKSGAAAKTLDLAEFSAATLRFSEMGFQASGGDLTMYSEEGDLTMAALLREQDSALMGSLEGEATKPVAAHKGGPSNEKGRNLLMQTLSVKASSGGGSGSGIVSSEVPPGPSASAAEVARRAQVQISSDDTLLDALIEDDAVFGSSSGGAAAETVDADEALNLDNSALLDDSLLTGSISAPAASIAPTLSSVSLQQQIRPAPSPVVAPVVHPPVPPPPVYVEGWLYQDPQCNVQGPFETSSMRRWLESGYFKEHLPIKLPNWSCFYPLGVVFPNPEVAFLGQTFEPGAPSPRKAQIPVPAPPAPAIVVAHATAPARAEQQQQLQQARTQLEEPAPASKRAVAPSGQSQLQQQVSSLNKPTVVVTTEDMSGSVAKDSVNVEDSGSPSGAVSKDKSNKDSKKTKKKTKKSEVTGAAGGREPVHAQTSSQHLPDAWGVTEGQKKSAAGGLSLTEIQQQEEVAAREKGTAKSFQLKNLLGVRGGTSGGSTAGGNAWAAGGTSASTGSQSTSSLKDIQQEQQSQSKKKKAQQQQQAPMQTQQQQQQKGGAGGASGSQWKAPVGSAAEKSLKEIMEEEQRAAAAQVEAAGASGASGAPSRPAPGSWAARAGGSRALESGVPANWSNDAPADSPAASIASISTAPIATKTSKGKAPVAVMSVNPDAPLPVRKKGSSPRKPSEIVEWSMAQVKSLNAEKKSSTEDLALIEFCLTLSSAVDIREYLAHYLGSTPQVSQFATEFIRRKEGKPPTAARAVANTSAGGTVTGATNTGTPANGGFVTTSRKKKSTSAGKQGKTS